MFRQEKAEPQPRTTLINADMKFKALIIFRAGSRLSEWDWKKSLLQTVKNNWLALWSNQEVLAANKMLNSKQQVTKLLCQTGLTLKQLIKPGNFY